MQILLIWEEVPEKTWWVALDEDSEIGKLALQCSGKFINAGEYAYSDPIMRLNEIISGDNSPNLQECGDSVITGPFSKVVVCGFVM